MNKKPALYPLKFYPILKEKVWGGSKLKTFLNKNGTNNTGESWEISGVEDNISVISNGIFKGATLNELLESYKETLVGSQIYKRFGGTFPLLFKFIDAKENLSVQLHPDNEVAKEFHNTFGKSEMWYVLNSDKDAKLILGFEMEMDKPTYLKHLSNNALVDILHFESIAEGDSFFLAPGLIHAIGAGVLLAEIQQTSDITYRVFDWNRPDMDGKLRELHTEMALKAINFKNNKARLEYSIRENEPSQICSTLFFEVNKLDINTGFVRDLRNISSFTVYMCVKGEAIMETDGFSENITFGETILIPANIDKLRIKTTNASFLEIYIP